MVHARSSYESGEVEWNARFASVYEPPGTDGRVAIDVGRLSAIERL